MIDSKMLQRGPVRLYYRENKQTGESLMAYCTSPAEFDCIVLNFAERIIYNRLKVSANNQDIEDLIIKQFLESLRKEK